MTASVINYLIVRPDMDEELVYRMTKGFFENLDQLAAAHSSAKAIKLDKSTIVSPVPIHPGAQRYYKEKASNRPAAILPGGRYPSDIARVSSFSGRRRSIPVNRIAP